MTIQLEEGQKALSLYISGFPPDFLRNYLKPKLHPEIAQGTENLYFWAGKYLDAFLKKQSNPMPESELTEELRFYVESKATYWLNQGNLLFQAEKYLKDEAIKMGIPYTWQSWADLNKQLIIEEYIILISTDCIEFWESTSVKAFEESRNATIKYEKGELKQSDYERSIKRYEKAKEKLKNSPEYEEKIRKWAYWTLFCDYVFKRYKKHLAGFEAWLECYGRVKLPCKFAINHGQLVKYPGRGQAKP